MNNVDLFTIKPAARSGHPGIDRWNSVINTIAPQYGVMPNLVKSIMLHESGGDANIVAALDGGCGLMQITSGVTWPFTPPPGGFLQSLNPLWEGASILEPTLNITVACKRFINPSMKNFPKNLDAVIAAYNAGDGAVAQALREGKLPATVTYGAWYVPSVHASFMWFQGISP